MAKEDVINGNRSCTDILFCLIFTAFWVGMIAVGGLAFTEGDQNILTYGIDTSGYLCGTNQGAQSDPYDEINKPSSKAEFKDLKNLYVLDITKLNNPTAVADSVCVSECPEESVFENAEAFVCQYHYRTGLNLDGVDEYATNYYGQLEDAEKLSSVGGQGPCWPVYMATTDFMSRCIPANLGALAEEGASTAIEVNGQATESGSDASALVEAFEMFTAGRSYLAEYMGDLLKGWVILVVGGCVGGLVFSLVWMTFLRFFAGCMAWVTITLVNVMCIGVTLFAATKAGLIGADTVGDNFPADVDTSSMPEAATGDDAKTFEYVTYVAAAISALVLLFTLIMIKRVKIAVGCIKVASQAISAMPMILFFPLVTFAMLIVLIVWWVGVAASLYACGSIINVCEEVPSLVGDDITLCQYELAWETNYQYVGLYHLFGLLWTNQWITGFGYMVIAGAVAKFYWANGDKDKVGMAPVMSSMKTTIRYHFGSIALGAFIVAVIQMIRIYLEYLDQKTKKLQEANPLLKYVMYCIKYCMWYLEKVMKFINRNAYILVAVKGTNYCSSALAAVKLILNNALRMAAVNTVGDSMLLVGEICVAAMCGVVGFLMADLPMFTDPTKATYLASPLLPVLACILIGFSVATVFFGVYEMAIDTVLLSFCEDCKMHNDEPQYAPTILMNVMGKK